MTHPLPTSPDPSSGCRLVGTGGVHLPLRETSLRADARGGLARVVVEQRFTNPHDEPLALTYQLPLPADGAVVDFAFRVGERRIQGEVEGRAAARERFERAVLEGHTAALLEQDRSSLFTQELGNVPPRAEVVAEITVEQPLAWRDGGWEWRFPTTVAPRYLGEPGRTPDAGRVTVDVADGPMVVRCHLDLRLGDALTGEPSSPSHAIRHRDGLVGLTEGAALDRDLVVRWPVAGPSAGVCLEVERPAGRDHAYGLLTVVPPQETAPEDAVPRDLILLVDTSGSMAGEPLRQAIALCRALVQGLGEEDQLEMIEFSSRPRRWSTAPRPMISDHRAEALRWLDGLRARSSTEMHRAIVEALRPVREDAQRQVVLVTDGLIGFEGEVIGAVARDLPAASRVHTVGVGSAVNRSLLGPVARAGRGLELIVGVDETVETAARALLARTCLPRVVNLLVEGEALLDVAPARCPDLFAGAPARLSLRLRPEGGGLVVRGRTADGPWRAEVEVPAASPGRRVVATRYARERVEDLELDAAAGEAGVDTLIEALGLTHGIATRLTSWVAVSETPAVDPTLPTRRERIPHALPHGLSAEGVGLRRASSPPAAGLLFAEVMGREAAASDGSVKMHLRSMRYSGLYGAGRAAAPSGTHLRSVPLPSRQVAARVVLRTERRLVVEFEVPEDFEWLPVEVAVLVRGHERTVEVVRPTTRDGSLRAGQVVRLSLAVSWRVDLPVRIVVRGATDLLLVAEAG